MRRPHAPQANPCDSDRPFRWPHWAPLLTPPHVLTDMMLRTGRFCGPFKMVTWVLGRGREGGLSGPAGPPAISSKRRGNSHTLCLNGGYSPPQTRIAPWRGSLPPHGVRALVLASWSFLGNGFMENHTTTNAILGFPPFDTQSDASHVPSAPCFAISPQHRGAPPAASGALGPPPGALSLRGPRGAPSRWAPSLAWFPQLPQHNPEIHVLGFLPI